MRKDALRAVDRNFPVIGSKLNPNLATLTPSLTPFLFPPPPTSPHETDSLGKLFKTYPLWSMEAPLSLALAIYPPCSPLTSPSSHRLACPFVPQNSPRRHPLAPCFSLVSSSSWILPILRPLIALFPWFPRRTSPSPTRSPLLLNRAHHPRGIPTFLIAATAFIPSNVSGRRTYKDGPEFNKSDNVRVYIVSRLAVPDNRQRIDFANANTFQRFSDRLINPS